MGLGDSSSTILWSSDVFLFSFTEVVGPGNGRGSTSSSAVCSTLHTDSGFPSFF